MPSVKGPNDDFELSARKLLYPRPIYHAYIATIQQWEMGQKGVTDRQMSKGTHISGQWHIKTGLTLKGENGRLM